MHRPRTHLYGTCLFGGSLPPSAGSGSGFWNRAALALFVAARAAPASRNSRTLLSRFADAIVTSPRADRLWLIEPHSPDACGWKVPHRSTMFRMDTSRSESTCSVPRTTAVNTVCPRDDCAESSVPATCLARVPAASNACKSAIVSIGTCRRPDTNGPSVWCSRITSLAFLPLPPAVALALAFPLPVVLLPPLNDLPIRSHALTALNDGWCLLALPDNAAPVLLLVPPPLPPALDPQAGGWLSGESLQARAQACVRVYACVDVCAVSIMEQAHV